MRIVQQAVKRPKSPIRKLGGDKRHGFEIKYADAPGRKRSMHIAIEDLGLEHLWVIYPGDQKYSLDSNITVLPLEEMSTIAKANQP